MRATPGRCYRSLAIRTLEAPFLAEPGIEALSTGSTSCLSILGKRWPLPRRDRCELTVSSLRHHASSMQAATVPTFHQVAAQKHFGSLRSLASGTQLKTSADIDRSLTLSQILRTSLTPEWNSMTMNHLLIVLLIGIVVATTGSLSALAAGLLGLLAALLKAARAGLSSHGGDLLLLRLGKDGMVGVHTSLCFSGSMDAKPPEWDACPPLDAMA